MKTRVKCYLHTDTDAASRFGEKYHFAVHSCELNYAGSNYALLAVQEVEFEFDEERAIQAQLVALKNKESDLRAKLQKELDGIAQQRQRLLSLTVQKTEDGVELFEAEVKVVTSLTELYSATPESTVCASENLYDAAPYWHTYYFTYGVGTKNANCYSVVYAKDTHAAHSYMVEKAGTAWAFCYCEEDFLQLEFRPPEVVPCGPSPVVDELS